MVWYSILFTEWVESSRAKRYPHTWDSSPTSAPLHPFWLYRRALRTNRTCRYGIFISSKNVNLFQRAVCYYLEAFLFNVSYRACPFTRPTGKPVSSCLTQTIWSASHAEEASGIASPLTLGVTPPLGSSELNGLHKLFLERMGYYLSR